MKKIAILFFLLLTQISFSQSHNSADIFGNPLGWFWGDTITASTPTAPTPHTYYVSATGNNSNTGLTPSDPFQTIAKINSLTLIAGDTVRFKGGDNFSGTALIIYYSGTASAPIVITSYGGSQAIIGLVGDGNGIALSNVDYVTIRNLKVKGNYNPFSQSANVSNGGINIINGADGRRQGITIDSCTVTNINGFGIIAQSYNADSAIKGGYNNLSITNCRIDSIGIFGIHIVYFKSSLSPHPNYGAFRNTNITVRNCNITRVTGWNSGATYSGDGMLISDCDTALIERCVVSDCGSGLTISNGEAIEIVRSNNITVQYCEAYGQISPAYDGGGIHFDYGVTNSVMQYNYAHNNWSHGFSVYGGSSGGYPRSDSNNTIRYNEAQNNGTGGVLYNCDISVKGGNDTLGITHVYNNTVYTTSVNADTTTSGVSIGGVVEGVNIRNNVFLTGDVNSKLLDVGGTLLSINIQGNLYWNTAGSFKLKDGSTTFTSYNYWQSAKSRELLSTVNVGRFANPLFNRPSNVGTIGNAYLLDTMTAHLTVGASPTKERGLNLDSLFSTNVGTADYYGNTLRKNDRFDIGCYENPDTYIWQDTTKLFIGQSVTPPTVARQYTYDSLYMILQRDSLLRSSRMIYIYATSDTILAMRNLKIDSIKSNRTGVTLMPFNVDSGFTGNASGVIATNVNLNTQSYGIYSLNSFGFGLYIRNDVSSEGVDVGTYQGGNYVRYKSRRLTGQNLLTINSTTTSSFAGEDNSIGWKTGLRRSSSSVEYYNSDTLVNSFSQTSTAIPSNQIWVGGISFDAGVTFSDQTTRKYSAFWVGDNMSLYRQSKLMEAIDWWMQRMGVSVIASNLVAPSKDLTAIRTHVGSSAGYLLRPYNPPQYTFAGDSLRMYMQIADSSKVRISKSVDGINWTANGQVISTPVGDSLIESVIRENGSATHWWGLRHYYDTNTVSLGYHSYFYKIQNSTDDGVTWAGTPDTLSDGSKWFGEDHTSFYHPDSNKYYLLLRRESSQFTLNRKISLVKTSDFVTFTPRTLVVPADSTNYDNANSKDYRKTFYFGSMFTTGAGEYWILATVYKIDTDEDETGQIFADTSGTDNCLWSELLFSEDGDNWKRTNDTNAFIPLNNGYRQIYGLPTVVGDSLFIYSFESTSRHIVVDTDHFDIWRYRISLADLRAYKP